MIPVKMLTNIAGTPSYFSGQKVELKDEIAKAWIADGLAVLDRDEKSVENTSKKL